MKTPFWIWVQRLLPQRLLCAFIYGISRSELKWIKSPLIRWFAHHYRIDLEEAAEPDLAAYPSFNAFFTRTLRNGARQIDTQPHTLVSPVDGVLTEFGAIDHGQLLQAKGFRYASADLLAEPDDAVAEFVQGEFATIYLAPHNYHRIHAPCDARLVAMKYVPGTRFSVNGYTTAHIDRLFCRNERLVCWFEAEFGRCAVVLVGALNVSSITTRVTGEIRSGRGFEWTAGAERIEYARGEEFATFNLGSTVVLVLPTGAVRWNSTAHKAMPVRLGASLGATAIAMAPDK
jgi:phosphatidylserine decarboxylase